MTKNKRVGTFKKIKINAHTFDFCRVSMEYFQLLRKIYFLLYRAHRKKAWFFFKKFFNIFFFFIIFKNVKLNQDLLEILHFHLKKKSV